MTTFEGTELETRIKSSTHIDLIRSVESSPENEFLEDLNVVVVIPAYNEEHFIGSVVIKARHFARTVIVVDDGSSDAPARSHKRLGRSLSHTRNL